MWRTRPRGGDAGPPTGAPRGSLPDHSPYEDIVHRRGDQDHRVPHLVVAEDGGRRVGAASGKDDGPERVDDAAAEHENGVDNTKLGDEVVDAEDGQPADDDVHRAAD